ncbi:unnamed protein product [Adineta steineri]|uniref:c-SKI SMAD4-binding domain-containing protein n=1 Tax=Adineta steineri TaxID=433720 RepID=A0A814FSY0_9BILA|nr:unnamed protein product [Adineta steineri]CAF0986318.1 unnamed protein product [Adineta steineri]CAF3872574.1 unnamed protein product [Adineta steineri]CAF3926044.1 unnamed protein product [Adineta steineri]
MTTTSTTSSTTLPSIDPQLLKLLARHHPHLQQQQPTAKEFLQHAFYYNHPPPNTVATNLPRHLLGNGLSKLNTENSISNLKLSTLNGKIDSQQISNDSQIKKSTKEPTTFDQWLQPPLGSMIQGPPCLQADTSIGGSKSETILSSGERITCFFVGGEKRLCLPEILNTVLKDFSLQEINAACERLHIYCSRCTNEQLDILKMMQVLPLNAPSCGLITQTDAERLCANLLQLRYKGQLRSVNSLGLNQYERLYSIKVQHKCFGKCSGTLYPTLYVAPHAECIQCDTCQALFSPKTFVSHGHKSEENRICHWGFNSDNWRAYLKIRSTEDNKAREELELFKEKFLNNNNNNNQKKRLPQQMDCLIPAEKRVKTIASSSDCWSTDNLYPYPQTAFSSVKKDNHLGDYPFSTGLPRPALIPSTFPSESTTTNRPSPLRVIRSNSPASTDPTNSSITNFNDYSPDGIRQIVESTVTSSRGRTQLLTYISQLQLAAYAHSSKNNSIANENQQNETVLLRRENEILRERISKLEATRVSSNSSTISKISSNDHNHQQDSTIGDLDDLESNISSNSTSSLIAHETVGNDQRKYFDRKRRLLAAEQQISIPETEILLTKKSISFKKACLDEIVDSLNQKAQAEREENNDDDEEIIKTTKNTLTSPSTTIEREEEDDEEDIDIDDGKVVENDH